MPFKFNLQRYIEGKYLPVFINFRLNFQYEAEGGKLGGEGQAGGGESGGGGGGGGGDYGDDDDEKESWPLDAYTMVGLYKLNSVHPGA